MNALMLRVSSGPRRLPGIGQLPDSQEGHAGSTEGPTGSTGGDTEAEAGGAQEHLHQRGGTSREVKNGPARVTLFPSERPNILDVLCFRQELTGKLPKEYPLDPGEEPPTVRRKIGTAFKLDEQKILPKGEVNLRPSLNTLYLITAQYCRQ